MRKLIRPLLFLIAIIMLLSSCATWITVPYLQPSVIDMGGYRNLALASVIPYKGYVTPSGWVHGADIRAAARHIYSGYSASTAVSVARYATDQLYSTLSSTGFFNILPPEATDSVLDLGSYGLDISAEFRDRGYDAVLIPRITGMSVSESVYTVPYDDWWVDANGNRHHEIEYEFWYTQAASIEYTLTVIDTETGRIAAQRTFADSTSREGRLDPVWSRLDDVSFLFRRMIRSFNNGIIRQFVPTERSYDVSLMSNKPKSEGVEAAYEAAADGDTMHAEELFLSEWENSRHLPSGYNATLLMAAAGDYDEAIDLLLDVMDSYSNEDVRMLYRDLLTIRARNEQAMDQVTGESSAVSRESGNGNAVYDLVMMR